MTYFSVIEVELTEDTPNSSLRCDRICRSSPQAIMIICAGSLVVNLYNVTDEAVRSSKSGFPTRRINLMRNTPL